MKTTPQPFRLLSTGCLPALILALLPVLFLLFPAISHGAQQHPTSERGFTPEKAYAFGDIDHVSLYNGALTLTLPIGPTYRVGRGLSYSLTLVYNSKLWDWEIECGTGNCDSVAWANRDSNSGLGWQLSLGRLVPPLTPPRNDTPRWLYISSDGSEHFFYDTLANEAPVANVYYSRDSTYLRLKKAGSQWQLEDGSGVTHTFNANGDLRRQEDAFGNYLTIGYDANTWDIADSTGRTHTLTFANKLLDGAQVPHLTRANLAAFGGQRALWNFTYQLATVDRPVPSPNAGAYAAPRAHFLTKISLPHGQSYEMGPVAQRYHLSRVTDPRSVGQIKAVDLPTGGLVAWAYENYKFYTNGEPLTGPGRPRLEFQLSSGVSSRRLIDTTGGELGKWTYDQVVTSEGGNPAVESITTVRAPSGQRTIHFFSTYQGGTTSVATANELDLGLPFTPKNPVGERRLSQRVLSAGGTDLRRVEVGYKRDAPAPVRDEQVRGQLAPAARDRNQRKFVTRTIYKDDGNRYAEDRMSGYDGVGHYRRTVRKDNFDGVKTRNQFTRYHPGGMPNTNQDWVLGTYTYQTTVDTGGATLRRDTCFDPATGFLKVERVRKANPLPGSDDVVRTMSYDRDPGSKIETVVVRHFGGDTGAVAAPGDVCALNPAHSTSHVALEHKWQYGSGRSSQYLKLDGSRFSFFEVLQAVDRNSGLISASTDRSGIVTGLKYDLLGRRTEFKPSAGHGAWTLYAYTNTFNSAGPGVEIRQIDRDTSAALAKRELRFDGIGRLILERQRQPGGLWANRVTAYSGEGWTQSESEWYRPAGTVHRTYFDYDAFGRVTKIVPPDGATHDVRVTYVGDRRVKRWGRVGTSVAGNGSVNQTQFATEEIYDGYGRLVRVSEPAGGLLATYFYDSGDRLKQANLKGGSTTQIRTFEYDGRGFLLSENHPEAQQITYSNHDSRGKARRRVQAGVDLSYTFDRAERLTLMREGSAGNRVLKELTYATTNVGSNRRRGKLEKAVRHNYVFSPLLPGKVLDAKVTEIYTYKGRDGRVSSRRTRAEVNGTLVTDFNQSWIFDGLGQVTQLGYPRCSGIPNCPNVTAPSPNRSFIRAQGYLVAVPGYASSLTYHPSGMIANVVHTNGLTDVWDEDRGRPRPSRISVTGTVAASLGDHSYDGSGNLVRRRFAGVFDDHYTYDGLNRIKVFEDSSGDQGYQYDPFGNLTGITGVNGRTLAVNRATNRLSGAVVYDGRGNILAWGSQLYSYDALGMMSTRNYPEHTYIYTADEERLWTFRWQGSFESLVETWTVRDLDGKVLSIFENPKGTNPWTFLKDYVYRGGKLLATDTALTSRRSRQHFSLDHLGSSRLTTDRNGAPIASHTYYPYGEEVGAAFDSEQLRFTGHERDFAGGTFDLDYMHARHCSPHLGRFMSVDPEAANVDRGLPQTWNAFTYGLNNPLRFVDRDGRKISLASLTDEQKTELVEQLREKTGLDLSLTDDGLLVSGGALTGADGSSQGSALAADFVSDAINSSTVFSALPRNSSTATFMGRAIGNLIFLDYDDIARIKHGNNSPATFDAGMIFLHELAHVFLGLKDPPKSMTIRHPSVKGATVIKMNKIRKQLGLEMRGQYTAAADQTGKPYLPFSKGPIYVSR